MNKESIKHKFGDKIREIRERRGITLKKVADEAEVSESLVSQIERNRVSPSIDTLLAIASVLEIDIDYLFKDYKQNKKVTIVRKNERKIIGMEGVIYTQLSLLSDYKDDNSIEALLIEIDPLKEKGSNVYGHIGKELGFILSGAGELLYGSETYAINEGDCISFSSDIPHILRNTGEEALRALWVITPPKMFFKED